MRSIITVVILMISAFATFISGQLLTDPTKNTRESLRSIQKKYSAWPSDREGLLTKYNPMDEGSKKRIQAFSTPTANEQSVSDVQVSWTRHWGSGLAPGFDQATDIVADESGNVYVTGLSSDKPFGLDYLTVKHSSSGAQLWTARYNGEGNGDDVAVDVEVDALGNVYVTGYSFGSGSFEDYVTVKYNSNGEEQWVARYDGPGHFTDIPAALTIDISGNAYVTGESFDSATSGDYATIKYNSAGALQWAARYNGPGNRSDAAKAIKVDDAGNVYVTGTDYATIKYNSDGIHEWVARYSNGAASSLDVDGSGNVYVTGSSSGPGTFQDYVTIKYNGSGVQQWIARYNGPGNINDEPTAIAVDGLGNVYVTGSSWGGANSVEDYATIKYSSSGVQEWVARYNGAGNVLGNFVDVPLALAVGRSGNVYVTGGSSVAASFLDYATVKYNSSGALQWVARYSRFGFAEDVATGLYVDSSENVYVTGRSLGSDTGWDYVTLKYDSTGNESWKAPYNGPGNSQEIATAIAVDGFGNVYVTGESDGTTDYATIRYNPDGAQQWVARYNGPGNAFDIVSDIVVDDLGNVYVAGHSRGSGTSDDYATIKYNSDGVEHWVARYHGGVQRDQATAIALDDSGNVYVTGWSEGSGFRLDYVTIKYNSEGVEQWVARYDGPDHRHDQATAIVVDKSGNVYVSGESGYLGQAFFSDYTTIKYNSAGVQQWEARYNGSGRNIDAPVDITIDSSENVYVTGTSVGSGTLFDIVTIKYNTNGEVQWVDRYDGPSSSDDQAGAIAADDWGNVFVAGTSAGLGWSAYTIIKYGQATSSVNPATLSMPSHYSLAQNFPNPFNPVTTISFDIPKASYVTLKVFNITGEEVATLVAEELNQGHFSRKWKASGVASGVYLYQLQAGEFIETKKLLLLR